MPRLIDADKLIHEIHNDWDDVLVWDESGEATAAEFERLVFEQPTVDAVEVVRCQDCESWGLNAIKKDEKGEVIYGDCLHFCCSTPKWFYCAWGERREDAKTD